MIIRMYNIYKIYTIYYNILNLKKYSVNLNKKDNIIIS